MPLTLTIINTFKSEPDNSKATTFGVEIMIVRCHPAVFSA
ncbi:hypothetical protein SESI111939_19565 [Serratia silvae]